MDITQISNASTDLIKVQTKKINLKLISKSSPNQQVITFKPNVKLISQFDNGHRLEEHSKHMFVMMFWFYPTSRSIKKCSQTRLKNAM